MTTVYIPANGRYKGIFLDYRGNRNEITIGAWTGDEHLVPPEKQPLGKFLKSLGITKENCMKAYKENK